MAFYGKKGRKSAVNCNICKFTAPLPRLMGALKQLLNSTHFHVIRNRAVLSLPFDVTICIVINRRSHIHRSGLPPWAQTRWWYFRRDT